MAAEHDQIPEAALAWLGAGKGVGARHRGRDLGLGAAPDRLAARDRRRRRDGGLGLGRLRRGRGGGRGARGAGGRRAAHAGIRRQRRRRLRGRARLRRHDPGAGRAGRRRPGAGGRRSSSGWSRRGPRGPPRRLRRATRATGSGAWSPGPADPLWPAAQRGARRRPVGLRAGDWFLGVHNPPLRMAVVGAVHIAQALVPMARLAGYDAARGRPARGLRQRGAVSRDARSLTTGPTRRWRRSGSTPARRW